MSARIGAVLALGFAATAGLASNPITTSLYTADPCAISYRDTLWIFTGHDENMASTGFIMNDWHVFSTDDLVNYKNWGSPLRATNFPWASGAAFASHVIERGGRFYWYVAALHKSIKIHEGFAIGVAVADHPKGPWIPVATPLVTDDTKNSIDLNIDPAVFVDQDGTAWLYWGSWSAARRAKLRSTMTEIDGAVETVSAAGFFEAPWMHRFDGNYYFSYASGYPSTTNYAMSTKLSGPWAAKGVINAKMSNSETNHQAILRHRGHWLFVYHTGDAPGGHTYHRSVAVDELYYDTTGAIRPIVRTATGPKKLDKTPIPDGSYRLVASHSGLALQDSGTRIVQAPPSASDSQTWVFARKGDGRIWTIRNAATGRFLSFSSAARLARARTVESEMGIVVENASAQDGYWLFADSSRDHVADVMDMSKDPGKEVVVWRRSGTLNQMFRLEKVFAATIADRSPRARIVVSATHDGIRLSRAAAWMLRDLSGRLLASGNSDRVETRGMPDGVLLLEVEGRSRPVIAR